MLANDQPLLITVILNGFAMGSVAKALWAYLAEPNVAAPVARTDGGIPLLPAGLRDILGSEFYPKAKT